MAAQNKSELSYSLAITIFPLLFINFTSRRLSHPSPSNLLEYPQPPPRAKPTTPTVGHPPPGNGYPKTPKASYISSFLTPPSIVTFIFSSSMIILFILLKSITNTSFPMEYPS